MRQAGRRSSRRLTDTERFQRLFGSTLFVYLARPDKLAQAVSYLKAEQTGLWHLAPNGTELERIAPHREPAYDGDENQGLCRDDDGL